MRARTALLLAAGVPLTVTTASVALKAGHWRLVRFPYGIQHRLRAWGDARP